MYEHIVIGAGINGSSAAYQLARRGRKVLLLEKVVTVTGIIDFKIVLNFWVICSSLFLTAEEVPMARAGASGRLTLTPSSRG